jgi:hypothetical protein
MNVRVHHNCKIDTERCEEGKRRSLRSGVGLRTDKVSVVCLSVVRTKFSRADRYSNRIAVASSKVTASRPVPWLVEA